MTRRAPPLGHRRGVRALALGGALACALSGCGERPAPAPADRQPASVEQGGGQAAGGAPAASGGQGAHDPVSGGMPDGRAGEASTEVAGAGRAAAAGGGRAAPPGVAAVPPGSALAQCAAGSERTPADRYKRSVACHLHARNASLLYQEPPPPMLRAVIVLSLRVDAQGRPARVSVLRSNGLVELEKRALQSVRDAAPLPTPAAALLRNGQVELTETWLFRDDGRFQLRTLAPPQADSTR